MMRCDGWGALSRYRAQWSKPTHHQPWCVLYGGIRRRRSSDAIRRVSFEMTFHCKDMSEPNTTSVSLCVWSIRCPQPVPMLAHPPHPRVYWSSYEISTGHGILPETLFLNMHNKSEQV